MKEKNVKASLMYELNNLHHVVVQAATVSDGQVYALQLLHKQTDTIVYQGVPRGGDVNYIESMPALYLKGVDAGGKAGGHTQTWVPSGKPGYWFVGTKPKKNGHYWDTQIARVSLPASGTATYTSNTQMPRLSYLNRAGSGFDDSVVYPGKEMQRSEAAVSPDLSRLLIATIGLDHSGHFALYDLNEVNQKLDEAQAEAKDVNVQNLHCLGAFVIPDFNSKYIPSIQGYDIDQDNNVYISCQPGPTQGFLGAKEGKPREIVKIPWGSTNPDEWEVANLDHDHSVNALGFVTEFESIQVVDPNTFYLTVAYHSRESMTTLMNRIYKIEGFNN